jgi:triacylglycerol esterase/lipase EstA (alpha/beta hydrolase family)
LANWQTYVQNEVVSPYAYLSYIGEYSANDTVIGSVISIFLNGWLVAQEPVPDTLITDCIRIPIQYVKFAQRVAVGQSPTPGVNTIAVSIDGIFSNGNAGVNLGNLAFHAMPPIVLVHGIRAAEDWFPNNGFTAPLDEAKVPYDYAVKQGFTSLDPGTIADTGQTLSDAIPAIAAEFGASHVHIVAHSKGGLWSRYFLKFGEPASLTAPSSPTNIGVLSLTTLDTPHNGSILADIAATVTETIRLDALVNPVSQLLIDYLSTNQRQLVEQVQDLTLEEVAEFNQRTGDPPAAFADPDGSTYYTAYSSVAADADIGDKTDASGRYVDSTDCAGMGLPTLICQAMYSVVGSEDRLSANSVNGSYSSSSYSFDLNDTVVTQNSSSWHQFSSPGSGFSTFEPLFSNLRKNHSTVGDECVAGGGACNAGAGVLGVIETIQSQY